MRRVGVRKVLVWCPECCAHLLVLLDFSSVFRFPPMVDAAELHLVARLVAGYSRRAISGEFVDGFAALGL